MDYFKWLLGVLIVLLLSIVALWIGDEPALITGQVHPTYETMRTSGSKVVASELGKWVGYLFGGLVITIFVLTIFIGAKRKNGIGPIRYWLAAGLIAYLGTYHLTIMAYWKYAGSDTTTYFLGLPSATAWVIYGLWSVPIITTLAYVFKFDEWIISPQEIKRFEELVKED